MNEATSFNKNCFPLFGYWEFGNFWKFPLKSFGVSGIEYEVGNYFVICFCWAFVSTG
jgi:hypothetical protein